VERLGMEFRLALNRVGMTTVLTMAQNSRKSQFQQGEGGGS